MEKLQYGLTIFSLYLLSLNQVSFSATDVHDLLPLYNLPKGLLPQNIKSYTLSTADNSFTIELSSHPCYVNFNGQSVYYDRIIKGKLGFGKVSEVSGIQAKKFFVWVSVTGIDVDETNGMIEFFVGTLSQKLPAQEFETIHNCKAKGLRDSFSYLEASI
ncbi:hypothetical protein Adt_38590 [Abeliophyllum distichum]|uniref:DUF538 family protein n=1 Tax=Abeliophyllum distichum TaxID=126358 RepID=A0ABD1Q5L7_9LAMI